MYYCEIIVDGKFCRGQGSSYRVAAMRAIEQLVTREAGGTRNAFPHGQEGTWENATIRTGRVR